jgi:hypothetical protein
VQHGDETDFIVDPSQAPKFGQVSDDQKAKIISDLQGLPQIAIDAQSKMAKLFMVAVERGTNPAANAPSNNDCDQLGTVISFVSPYWVQGGSKLIDSTRRSRSLLAKRVRTDSWPRTSIWIHCAIGSLRL